MYPALPGWAKFCRLPVGRQAPPALKQMRDSFQPRRIRIRIFPREWSCDSQSVFGLREGGVVRSKAGKLRFTVKRVPQRVGRANEDKCAPAERGRYESNGKGG